MKKAPHPVDVAVGANIRAIRLARRMSQTDLGDNIGVSFQQVQKYERGTNRVSASKLVEIAYVLQCSTAELLAGADKDNPKESAPAVPVMSREAIRIARLFDELSDRQRFALRKLMETLVEEETEAMGSEAA